MLSLFAVDGFTIQSAVRPAAGRACVLMGDLDNTVLDRYMSLPGVTCEDPPGLREGSGLYLAYLRDPSGNKICALHRAG